MAFTANSATAASRHTRAPCASSLSGSYLGAAIRRLMLAKIVYMPARDLDGDESGFLVDVRAPSP